jgi:hypothetical protein
MNDESRRDPAGACPACGSRHMEVFFEETGVPTNSCLLLEDPDRARDHPTGTLRLAICASCAFIANVAFDPQLAEYSTRYEETQAYSPRFVEFAKELAHRWVDRYDLVGGDVIEIGCGKGEFLEYMLHAGVQRAVGIDPGLHPERLDPAVADRITPVTGFFDASFGELVADAIVCRHTLEHIQPVAQFMRTVRAAIGDRRPVVLFELPDVRRVLDEVAFWDVYYEHCSYFTGGSLARLFRSTGFEPLAVDLDYDGQYLLIEAEPADTEHPAVWPDTDDAYPGDVGLVDAVEKFGVRVAETIGFWRSYLRGLQAAGGSAVIWGAGSKGVSFLTSLGDETLVDVAVDVNPHKEGMCIAGTGQRIVSPSYLVEHPPDTVLLMNPIYMGEVRRELARLGLEADLVAV